MVGFSLPGSTKQVGAFPNDSNKPILLSKDEKTETVSFCLFGQYDYLA